MKLGKIFFSFSIFIALSEEILAAEELCPTLQDINSAIRNHEKSLRFQEYEFSLQKLGEHARVLKLIKGERGSTKIECHYRFRDRVDNRRVIDTVTLTAPVSD